LKKIIPSFLALIEPIRYRIEYSTFVVGGTQGLYSLLLHEKDFATADQVLTRLEENKD
jgi:hypothetical protein